MRLRGLHWFNAPGSDAIHSSESRVQFCIRTSAGNFWLFLKHTGRTPKLWENAVATFWVLHAGRDRACLASGGEDTGTSSAGLRPSHGLSGNWTLSCENHGVLARLIHFIPRESNQQLGTIVRGHSFDTKVYPTWAFVRHFLEFLRLSPARVFSYAPAPTKNGN